VGLDLGRMHGWIVGELSRNRPVAESMAALIDECEAARPHPDWRRLRSLPFADLSALTMWMQHVFSEPPPTRPLRGLWFGLFNPCDDSGDPSADIYVSGSERFNPDPGSPEWAVGPDWWPDARFAGSSVLADIYRLAYRGGGLGNDAEYPLCLGYGAFAVRESLGEVDPALILDASPTLGVAVGFDSGDFVLLGEFGPSGFATPAEPRAAPDRGPGSEPA
jgi:hypothetical protein